MTISSYFVNTLSVIFIPEKDRENNFSTIVFNPETENILKVNRFGYVVLKVLDTAPGLSLARLKTTINQKMDSSEQLSENHIEKFVETMVKEHVIVTDNG